MGCVLLTQDSVSVGGLPWSRPLGDFLPASSFVEGVYVNGLTLGGVPHAGGWAGLVPSSASSFPGLPPPTGASSAIAPHIGVSSSQSQVWRYVNNIATV
jgi:hypothetical protein